MVVCEGFVERRAHERYRVKDGIVAVPHAASMRFGRIKDISMGGLTVRYFDEEEWHDKSFEISIPEAEIQKEVARMANEINRDLADKDPIFLGILNGAFEL